MNDLIKKGFYLGLGATLASKEKAEKYIKEFVKSGELAPNEAKKILEELSAKGKDKQESWNESMRSELKSSIQKLGFVTQEEFDALKDRLNELEEKLNQLEK